MFLAIIGDEGYLCILKYSLSPSTPNNFGTDSLIFI